MDITSYTSNIQPYGPSGGTKLASDSENAKNAVSTQTTTQVQEPEKVQRKEVVDKPNPLEKLVKERNEQNKQELEKMMETMNDFVNSINKGLSFRVDQEAGREVVTIYEASTGDVIRQIPDEEMLIILRRLAARNSGLFVEEKV
ncbi:flagellar protein FlaG [Vibrio sp. HN007]|uniref:flagellar protein FlaG n=1 Tax=Vibrio iocasae TaxID=3098914 RepID=UPI0035D487C8